MKITKKTFGVLSSGEKVYLYTLKAGELVLSISSLGATWTSLVVPSRKTGAADIILGYSALGDYTHNKTYIGATIGRFGNRIGNARFTLGGQVYNLYKNDGTHTLHGGRWGFDKRLWTADAYEERDGIFVRFELTSPDGDEGYPGCCKASVCYGLTKSNEIVIDYEGGLDMPCPVNFTNHSYFNLAGEGAGSILSHEVKLFASSYIEVDETLIPTGKLIPVANTPFDFRTLKSVKQDMVAAGGGYDHCFALDGVYGELRPAAEVFEAGSGRTMKVFTTQPGIQFYTGNFLDNVKGKMGSIYNKHAGFCLETQHFPDSPNRPEFPSAIFGPDRDYHEKVLFSFDW
ncbi:MAG: galactose mutarotase [Treponema sp.]|jgi:aldose 1-epimerase|nr:galactose mutarotase [Treponema sp.]